MNQLARDRNEKTLSKKFFVVLFFRVSFFLFWAIQRQRTFGTKLCSSANAFCFAQMQDSIPVYCIVHVLCMYYALGTCVYNWDDTAWVQNLRQGIVMKTSFKTRVSRMGLGSFVDIIIFEMKYYFFQFVYILIFFESL